MYHRLNKATIEHVTDHCISLYCLHVRSREQFAVVSVVCKALIDDEEGPGGTAFVGFIMLRYVLHVNIL